MATMPIGCGGRLARAVGRLRRRPSRRAAAALVLLGCAPLVVAQSSRSSAADDLRPAYATPSDIADGKRVADGMCAKCHGASGISATRGVPHLAGQRPSYLYAKIKAYQTGAR